MILGVTGSIASGKSLVTKLLQRLGASVLSADELSRELVAIGAPLLTQLAETFGPQVVHADGSLNREYLAALVFDSPALRKQLDQLMHPAIAELSTRRLAALAAAEPSLVVYEAPLLFEAGAEKRVDKVLVVTIAAAIQVERLMKRDLLSQADAEKRIRAQIPQAAKVARADYLLDNSSTIEALEAAVEDLWRQLPLG